MMSIFQEYPVLCSVFRTFDSQDRKAKKSGRKQNAKQQKQACLEMAEWWGKHGIDQGNWNPDIQEEIYTRLDKIVQSSALVECINSIIRPYFNTSKNQISQEQLNLIMHYHNHRRYLAGVRKHKTPMEILTVSCLNLMEKSSQ